MSLVHIARVACKKYLGTFHAHRSVKVVVEDSSKERRQGDSQLPEINML